MKALSWNCRCGFNNGVCLNSKGRSGGMGFWWDNLDVNILSYDNHHFFSKVLENDKLVWGVVGFMGGRR